MNAFYIREALVSVVCLAVFAGAVILVMQRCS